MRSILRSIGGIRLHCLRTQSTHIPFEIRVPQECIRLSDVPLLSSIVQSFQEIQPMKDYTILNIQHELGDISAQIEALIVLGALPSDIYFLPPSYSSNKQFEYFLSKHFHIPKENFFQSSSYRLRYNYDQYRLFNVIYHLHRMIQIEAPKTHNRLLVLDDGGCFSEAVSVLFDINDKQLIRNLPLSFEISQSDIKLILSYLQSREIHVVEQTSRGIFKYLDQSKIALALKRLGISIIDVATSEPKKRLEPSIIAEACLNMLSYLFYDASSDLKIAKPSQFDRCLLLGYGAIGKALAYALTHTGDLGMFSKENVQIWDPDLVKQQLAKNDGFKIFNQWNNQDEFNYIIGCAGRCSLPISSLTLLRDHSYLISVSSGAIEFPFNEMIEYALAKNTNISLTQMEIDRLDEENIHRNIRFKYQNKKYFTVVNGGMPITFLGILNPTNPEKFDLTISTMIAASIQAVFTQQQHHRIIPLDSTFSKFICQWFDRNYDEMQIS